MCGGFPLRGSDNDALAVRRYDLFFAKEEIDARWRAALAVGWVGLRAVSHFLPWSGVIVMTIVAIIDIGLLYAVLGEYATKVEWRA